MWIDVGLPDEKRVRRACGRAKSVIVYAYGRGFDLWWKQSQTSLERSSNLTVVYLPSSATQALAKLATRTMELNCTIQDGQVWLADGNVSVQVEFEVRLPGPR
jgi:uncharacterized protein YaeQ